MPVDQECLLPDAPVRALSSRTGHHRPVFIARLLQKGTRYGNNNQLIYDSEKPAVEFYDARYCGKGFTNLGQFVTRYTLETLAARVDQRPNARAELYLDAGISDWRLTDAQVRDTVAWARRVLNPTNETHHA